MPPSSLERTFLPQSDNQHEQALRLLLIEDNDAVREACCAITTSLGYIAEPAGTLAEARCALRSGCIDIVLLDLNLRDQSGLILLEEIKLLHPRASIIMMTAYATVNSAVQGLRKGVSDYIEKPFTVEELRTSLERAARRPIFDAEARRLDESLHKGRAKGALTARSVAMSKVRRTVARVAFITHPVLIIGEPGTGKEYIARSIHDSGPGVTGSFRIVDCGRTLDAVERDLFDRLIKGSEPTTDGMQPLGTPRPETLFLKDINVLPLDLQDQLLATLSNDSRSVGQCLSNYSCPRILAGTSRDLSAMVEAREFRRELFNRLNMINIRIPALRDRREDIPMIAASVFETIRQEGGYSYRLADDAMALLMEHDWPGNVRELERSLRYASALSSDLLLRAGDFPILNVSEQQDREEKSTEKADEGCTLCCCDFESQFSNPLSLAEMERRAIITTLRRVKGDKLHAAKLLGIGKTTLYRKLREYRIADPAQL